MNIAIRSFTPADYPALAEVMASAYSDAEGRPLLPISEQRIREEDAECVPPLKCGRWVAEVDGRVVGGAEYDQEAGRYHPQKFWVDIYVDSQYQRRGVGAALHRHILAMLQPHNPLAARGATREDLEQTIHFLQGRGWREASRVWESFLDVLTFDPAAYAGIEEHVQQQGIVVKTLPELADDPERDQQLYELMWEIRQDFPDLDAATRESFAEFVERQLQASNLIPEAYFVAVRDGEYLGLATHTSFGDATDTLRIGQTGVKRAYRRRKIALALKLRGIGYAREHGYTRLRTVNESSNHGILAINERMGFRKQPAWIDFVRSLHAEQERPRGGDA